VKVKGNVLRQVMKRYGVGVADLARGMGVDASEVQKMLNGEVLDIETSRKFMNFFSAGNVQYLVDWPAIGKTNPLACRCKCCR